MMKSQRLRHARAELGDIAVDGLLAGVAAGAGMAAVLAVAGVMGGESVASTLSRFDSGAAATPIRGALIHLAVAGVYGMLFSLAYQGIGRRVPGWLAGLGYGLFLLGLAEVIIIPRTHSALQEIPLAPFALAHIVYGLLLGLQIGRMGGRREP